VPVATSELRGEGGPWRRPDETPEWAASASGIKEPWLTVTVARVNAGLALAYRSRQACRVFERFVQRRVEFVERGVESALLEQLAVPEVIAKRSPPVAV
jgi:hypothetical protein